MPASNGSGVASAGAQVELPFHRIILSPSGKLALLLSPSRVILLKLGVDEEGQASGGITVLSNLVCPTAVPSHPYSSPTLCFPRHAAISPDERLVAILGDDKVLHVYDITAAVAAADGGVNAFEQGKQVLVRPVPKRANTVLWEENSRHIVIGDRFGDIRVLPVDESTQAAVRSVLEKLEANANAPKDQPKGITKNPAAAAGGAESDDEDGDDPQDPWASPRVGHTSMLIAALLVGASPAPNADIARHIITADRDEHIRISRWGPVRAGWVVENYLLGSDAFVGALALLPAEIAQATFGTPGAADGTGLLLASDGGRKIRVWNYLDKDCKTQQVAAADVSAAILPHVVMKGKGVQGRGNKKAKNNKKATEEQIEQQEPALRFAEENSKLAIMQLIPFEVEDQTQVLFTAEGSTAFFSLPLSALASASGASPVDVSSHVQTVPTGAVVLDLSVQREVGHVRAWVTTDVVDAATRNVEGNSLIRAFDFVAGSWKEAPKAGEALLGHLRSTSQPSLIDTVDNGQAKKLAATFYDALKTYPKLAGESSSNANMPMTSAGVYEVSPLVGTAAAKRKENMDRIRAAAAAATGSGSAEAGQAPRKKVKKEPKEERVYEIMAVDEQVGGGPRKKGKGKAVEQEAETEAEGEANDAEEVEVEVAEETEVAPEASDAAAAEAGKVSMEERLAKMKELRKKMTDSARANRKDVIAEQARQRNGGQSRDPHKKSWKLHKAEKILEERDIRESGEDVDRVRAWGYSIEDNEAWEKKLEDQEERRDKGPVDFNTAAERSYQRQVRNLKPDLKEYERTMVDASAAAGSSSSGVSQALIRTPGQGSSSTSALVPAVEQDALSYGTHKPSEAAMERLASHINNEHEVRANRSRKRPVDPDAEVTYINEKNRRFNEKAERFFGKYTKEIRDSFERGTAL
ncbi:Pre-mRNA-splicing factor SYF2 [Tilletia horrida]|uniref:Pre-mRNA-splicing factor SYF2 n=1 Tax=Tilletia horrida TaxID=155126 RepID=A0AAN6G8Z8_9BASI|nr:Pre-mRNA-splicing factor SYF2 [Tilletia horrida]